MLRLSFALFIAFLSPVVNAQENKSLTSATYEYLSKRGDDSHPVLRTYQFDLNGDGREDAIVLLTGNKWCGSGGCNMLVFQGTEKGFSLVSTSTITNIPIAVLPETKHGWHTLIVRSGKTGMVLMRFNGQEYPSNPSMQPTASSTETKGAQELNMKQLTK
jgi:hypothetical protein